MATLSRVMTNEPFAPHEPANVIHALHVSATGVWAVRSASRTVYYLDLDRRRLLRVRGAGSPNGPHDGSWVRLVSFATPAGEVGVIRIGERHELWTDPGGWAADLRFWIPRTCTRIERIDRDVAAALAEPG